MGRLDVMPEGPGGQVVAFVDVGISVSQAFEVFDKRVELIGSSHPPDRVDHHGLVRVLVSNLP